LRFIAAPGQQKAGSANVFLHKNVAAHRCQSKKPQGDPRYSRPDPRSVALTRTAFCATRAA
jgi:hypothetical protein